MECHDNFNPRRNQTMVMSAESSAESIRADLIQVDKTLESLRDSGFDLATASGEVVDNAIDAGASVVRIRTVESAQQSTDNLRSIRQPKSIEAIAFADNGTGIPLERLPHTLTLGYSIAYNQRHRL